MKAQKQARASLVIIAYNDEAHVARAIRSVCEQTERNIEIICVDDGSADDTCGIMRRWAEEDSRIRVITQPNAGILGARYAGLQQASGDYVLFLDSDDTLTAEAVETACGAADELGADVVEFGVSLVIDQNNPPAEDTWAFLEDYFSQNKARQQAQIAGLEARNVSVENSLAQQQLRGDMGIYEKKRRSFEGAD